MRKLITAALVLSACMVSAGPTNEPGHGVHGISLNPTNHEVVYPADFWGANAAAIIDRLLGGTNVFVTAGNFGLYGYPIASPVSNLVLRRYVDRGDGTTEDTWTKLIWDKNATHGPMNWTNAVKYISELNAALYKGFNDWRLPSVNKLDGLTGRMGAREMDSFGELPRNSSNIVWANLPGTNRSREYSYWSSTSLAELYAWHVSFATNYFELAPDVKEYGQAFVWPCRNATSVNTNEYISGNGGGVTNVPKVAVWSNGYYLGDLILNIRSGLTVTVQAGTATVDSVQSGMSDGGATGILHNSFVTNSSYNSTTRQFQIEGPAPSAGSGLTPGDDLSMTEGSDVILSSSNLLSETFDTDPTARGWITNSIVWWDGAGLVANIGAGTYQLYSNSTAFPAGKYTVSFGGKMDQPSAYSAILCVYSNGSLVRSNAYVGTSAFTNSFTFTNGFNQLAWIVGGGGGITSSTKNLYDISFRREGRVLGWLPPIQTTNYIAEPAPIQQDAGATCWIDHASADYFILSASNSPTTLAVRDTATGWLGGPMLVEIRAGTNTIAYDPASIKNAGPSSSTSIVASAKYGVVLMKLASTNRYNITRYP